MIASLGWGTGSSFGAILDDHEAEELIKSCLDSGLTLFDTGPSYAGGKSEKLLGRCLKSLGVEREKLIISSKIGSYSGSFLGRPVTRKDYGRDMTCRLVEQSLVNLQSYYIDILFFHSLPSCFMPPAETLNYLQSLKESGVIKAIGVSAHSTDELKWIVNNIDFFDVVMTHFNPITAPSVEEFLAFYRSAGKVIFGSAPYASGLLIDGVVKGGIDDLRPAYGVFKRLRNLSRYSKMNKDYRQRLAEVRSKVADGFIDPLEYSLTSELVDVTIFGSLSCSRIGDACASARNVGSRRANK